MRCNRTCCGLLALLLSVMLAACSIEEAETAQSIRKASLLGDWRLTSQQIVAISYNGVEFSENQFGLIENALGADIPEGYFADSSRFTFYEETYEIAQPGIANPLTGNWSLGNNMDTVYLDLQGEQAFAIIEALDSVNLRTFIVLDSMQIDGNQLGGKLRLSFLKEE